MRAHLAAVAVVASCALGACGDDGSPQATSDDPSARAADQGPLLTFPHEGDFWQQARVEGRLMLDHGCLMIGEYVPYFDEGTTWEASTRTIRFEDGKSISVGEHYQGGGGYISLDEGDLATNLAVIERVEGLKECLDATGARAVVFTNYAPG